MRGRSRVGESGRRRHSAVRKTTAVLFATAADESGGPAACLPLGDMPLLSRLIRQLIQLGVDEVTVVTRPEWEPICTPAAAAESLVPVRVHVCADLADDLRAVARVAAAATDRLLLASGDTAAHREALAGLLRDPRVSTAALSARAASEGSWAAPLRVARGRIVSAGSAFHQVRAANAVSLGVLLVDPADAAVLAAAASELARLSTPPYPLDWLAQSGAREAGARSDDVAALLLVGLVRANVRVGTVDRRTLFLTRPTSVASAAAAAAAMSDIDEDRVLLDSAVKASDGFFTTFFVSPYSRYLARWAARRGWTPNQVTTLSMLVGVLAAAAFATGSRLGLIAGAVLLQVAFTFDCVDGQIARYTRTFSALGAWLDSVFDRGKEYLVYAGLALGSVRGFHDDVWLLAALALSLQTVRHTVDFSYAAGQHRNITIVARPSLAVAVDAVVAVDGDVPADVPPGVPADVPADPARRAPVLLGVGAGVGGVGSAARPAEAATSAATVRAATVRAGAAKLGSSGPGTARMSVAPGSVSAVGRRAIRLSRALEGRGWMRYGKKILVLPIGERFALISITAAAASPRTTFVALLGWGSVAAVYSITGKTLRSVAR